MAARAARTRWTLRRWIIETLERIFDRFDLRNE